MIGPCLCGDPYCSSCGNPAQAKLDDAIESITEEMEDLNEYELQLVSKYIEFIKNTRYIREQEIRNATEGYVMDIESLQDDIEAMKGE